MKKKESVKKEKLLEQRAEDAFQIWPVLVWAAKNQQTMTYKDLYNLTGIEWNAHKSGRRMARSLDIIYRYCEDNLKCHLTVLVVDQTTGRPGGENFAPEGGYDKARQKVFTSAQKKGDSLKSPKLKELKVFIKIWNKKNEKNFGS